MIRSVSEIGEMVDFLMAFPNITRDEYIWGMSIPMIKIMGMDNSHVNNLSEKEAEKRKGQVVNTKGASVQELNNDLGVAINFNNE